VYFLVIDHTHIYYGTVVIVPNVLQENHEICAILKISCRYLFSPAVDVWIGGLFAVANAVDWVTGEEWLYNGTWFGSYPTHLATQKCMQMRVTHDVPDGQWKVATCDASSVYVCEKDMA